MTARRCGRVGAIVLGLGLGLGLIGGLAPGLHAGAMAADTLAATLTVTRDETCRFPTMSDAMHSTDTVAITLPPTDGPVAGSGTYSHTGSGYTLAGPSAYRGRVRGDGEDLMLTFGQWHWQGKALTPAAPEMPTAAAPVVLPLEPGAERRIDFQNAHADTAPCTGTVVYRLDFTPETQVWTVDMTGFRMVEHLTSHPVLNAAGTGSIEVPYRHGVRFGYRLAARFILTRLKGAWRYTDGTVTAANVDPRYIQVPALYAVKGLTCATCGQVSALAGQGLSGSLSGQSVTLSWPTPTPAVTVASVFARPCPPGPWLATCQHNKKSGTVFGEDDDDFLQRAGGHALTLAEGATPPRRVETPYPGAYRLVVEHHYTLHRVK